MTWRTHTLAGISSLWLLTALPGAITSETVGFLAALAAFGALLPDLDAMQSKITFLSVGGIRPFALPAAAIHRAFGHRGLLHSLAGLFLMGLFCLALTLAWEWQASLALWMGYASHLAADACTRSGIPLFFPNKKRYRLLPMRLCFVTGSLAEEMLLPFLTLLVFLLLFRYSPFSPSMVPQT